MERISEDAASAGPAPLLAEAARAYGIEREYWDIWGKHHDASPEVLRAILKSLGVDAEADLTKALDDKLWREWSSPLPRTIVLGGPEREIPVSLPADQSGAPFKLTLRLEDGSERPFDIRPADAPTLEEIDLRGRRFVRKQITLPEDLPLGYHEISAHSDGQPAATARLIVCPERTYQPDWFEAGRAAGLGVSLYGLRSARNWGCGDFTDLKAVIDFAADEVGAGFIALNPLHAIGNRQPYNTSPYLPNSVFYRNFLYLDLERIEDGLQPSGKMRYEIESLRAAEFVEYERVARLKTRALKVLFRRFLEREHGRGTPRDLAFRRYVEDEGELLERFALYSALDEAIHKQNPEAWNWRAWPEPYRDPESPACREFGRRRRRGLLFHKYVQWQLEIQLESAQQYAVERGLRIGLYNDLALATDNFGFDVWAHRPFYVAGCRVGAPPDDFSPHGQDWAFPPPNSERHFEDGYRLFAESIRKSCRHGGALRIDHVMRFYRLFWIPEGMEAAAGTYVLDRQEDLLRILALESVRNRVIVIGEDLGTVPDELREALGRFGVLSYRLFYFERDKEGKFITPEEYPPQALVSTSTHDLPTLAGYWLGRDIEARRDAGIVTGDAALVRMAAERQAEKQTILDLLFERNLLPDWPPRDAAEIPELAGDLHNAIVGFLASTPCKLFLLNQEDLLKETEQQNLPGSTAEYPNWRRKMKYSVEELKGSPEARGFALMLRRWLEETGRLNPPPPT